MTVESTLQIAANLATVIGIPLLLWQLRILIRSAALDSNNTLVQWDREIWGLALANPGVAPKTIKALWGTSEAAFAMLLIDEFEHAFLRFRKGAYERDIWLSHEAYAVRCLQAPEVAKVWAIDREIRPREFVEHFDKKLAEATVHTAPFTS